MKLPKIILSIILMLMIVYDFMLHLADQFGWSYQSWGPANLFPAGTFIWGSTNYTLFWTSYWGSAAVMSIILSILLIKGDKHERQ